jgi:hypothetical protein
MDKGSLVARQIDDGRYLVEKLLAADFDVSATAWVKTPDDKWSLYVVSKAVDEQGLTEARGASFDILRRVKPLFGSDPRLHLERLDSSFARTVFDIRNGIPDHIPVHGTTLTRIGDVVTGEYYLYPPIAKVPPGQEPLTPSEVVQKVVGLMSRAGAVRPSHVTLRDGTAFFGVPFGLERGDGHMHVKFTIDGFEPPRVCPVESIRVID